MNLLSHRTDVLKGLLALVASFSLPAYACEQSHYLPSNSKELSLAIKPNFGKVQTTNVFLPYQAMICSGSGATTLSTVVTGVRSGEVVYLLASRDKDIPSNLAANSKLRIGRQQLTLVSQVDSSITRAGTRTRDEGHLRYARLNTVDDVTPVGTNAGVAAGDNAAVQAVAVDIDLERLRNLGFGLAPDDRFYLQAVISNGNGSVRLTKLDEVRVGPCAAPAVQ